MGKSPYTIISGIGGNMKLKLYNRDNAFRTHYDECNRYQKKLLDAGVPIVVHSFHGRDNRPVDRSYRTSVRSGGQDNRRSTGDSIDN